MTESRPPFLLFVRAGGISAREIAAFTEALKASAEVTSVGHDLPTPELRLAVVNRMPPARRAEAARVMGHPEGVIVMRGHGTPKLQLPVPETGFFLAI